MFKRIVQKIKTKKIGKNSIISNGRTTWWKKKSRLRAFARTRAKKNPSQFLVYVYFLCASELLKWEWKNLYHSSHCTKLRYVCQKFIKGAISSHQIYKLQTRKVEQSAMKRKEDKICKRTESELRRGKDCRVIVQRFLSADCIFYAISQY